MSPRPVSIDDRVLLDAARAVFLEKGMAGTTAEVAKRAGVSEGTLFHRFGSKAALFRAAMNHEVFAAIGGLSFEDRLGQGEIEIQLATLIDELIALFSQLMPRIMMSWSNRTEGAFPQFLREPNPPPLRVLKRLIAYFDAEMRLGRLRAVDPEVLARACLGGALQYVFMELLGSMHGRLPLPQPVYVRGLTDVLLNGAGSTSPPNESLPTAGQTGQRRSKKGGKSP